MFEFWTFNINKLKLGLGPTTTAASSPSSSTSSLNGAHHHHHNGHGHRCHSPAAGATGRPKSSSPSTRLHATTNSPQVSYHPHHRRCVRVALPRWFLFPIPPSCVSGAVKGSSLLSSDFLRHTAHPFHCVLWLPF